MELLTEGENQEFLLEREIVGLEYEGVLRENEVVSDDDDVEPAQPLDKVDMSDDDIEERPAKRRRKLHTHLASEVVRLRSGLQTKRLAPARMRMTNAHARKKEAEMEDEWPSAKDLQPLKWQTLDGPMKRPIVEDEEGEEETEIETLDNGFSVRVNQQRLWSKIFDFRAKNLWMCV
ncbi:hypothetical protein AXG93_2356s1060 [Marchantia polymorpha subsp. ruderalis]|uniref:Uncharacterized protein n=1 Tax=Marchantia polymorpha subsp. ruderalis TaxID=1480154 RepID=A0A176WF62_MARPO|nr:hypothetical protein AXG93_2356s1060 [Marchantia polymorpha subsp. ruderalis]